MERRSVIQRLMVSVTAWTALNRGRASAEDAAKPAEEAIEEEIPLARVPAVIRKSADAAVPKATWEAAYRCSEEGEITYELEGLDAKGREVVVVLTKDGQVDEIETEIPLRELPEVITTAVKSRWPRFKASSVYEVCKKDGEVIGYDLEGKRPRDKHVIGIFVSADGEDVQIDEAE